MFFLILIELCTGWDVVVYHQQMERFFAVLLVHSADDHTAGVDAHHCAWWQVGEGNQGFADEFIRFVVFANTATGRYRTFGKNTTPYNVK